MGLRRLLFNALLSVSALTGQSVTRIYVEPFISKSTDTFRVETIKLLKTQKGIEVVADIANADRVLAGSDQTYIKGYLSRNPRVRYRNSDSRPVYGGYVSVELKDRHEDTVWSYLATPRRFGPEEIGRNMAGQIVSKLQEFLMTPSKGP
jgi:hypothetical protein